MLFIKYGLLMDLGSIEYFYTYPKYQQQKLESVQSSRLKI